MKLCVIASLRLRKKRSNFKQNVYRSWLLLESKLAICPFFVLAVCRVIDFRDINSAVDSRVLPESLLLLYKMLLWIFD